MPHDLDPIPQLGLIESAIQKPIRILIADDDEINLAILTHMLKAQGGFSLTLAENGREALEQAVSNRFDVLIFDLNMPFINGDRLIRHLRASQSLNANSVIFLLTAEADSNGMLGNNRTPHLADQVLAKPIRSEALFRAIFDKLRR